MLESVAEVPQCCHLQVQLLCLLQAANKAMPGSTAAAKLGLPKMAGNRDSEGDWELLRLGSEVYRHKKGTGSELGTGANGQVFRYVSPVSFGLYVFER